MEVSSETDYRNPPFETQALRSGITLFLDQQFETPPHQACKIGNYRWGVYAFYDYDGEPIYVGQTKEKLGTRIRRHLTNQRTDAVAMSVLDPFEVREIEVWPLPEYQRTNVGDQAANDHLNALENSVFQRALKDSKFHAILNEKNPPSSSLLETLPSSYRSHIISPEVHALRSHPDLRIARRCQTIARLAQVISERQVQGGLRRVLVAQAKRLQWLAEDRYVMLGGAASVEQE